MKQKIIDYIEQLEAKALQTDDYFKQRNELYIENQKKDKEIERLNNIINESNKMIEKIVEEVYKPIDKEWDSILCFIEDYKLKIKELKGSE